MPTWGTCCERDRLAAAWGRGRSRGLPRWPADRAWCQPAGRARRDPGGAGAQRRRQVHAGQVAGRYLPALQRSRAAGRRGRERAAGPPPCSCGHRLRASDGQHLHHAVDRGQPARGRPPAGAAGAAPAPGRSVGAVPRPGGQAQAAGPRTFRRAAADAGRGAGADDGAARADARRAQRRAVAADGEPGVPTGTRHRRRRHRRADGGAERQGRAWPLPTAAW